MLELQMDLKTARRISREHNNQTNEIAQFSWTRLSLGDVLALNNELPVLVKVGVTEDHTDCDLCGKAGLKHTVAFRVLDSGGQEVFLGSDCAESVEFAGRYR
jgi:hypothetical protein